jgi:hypothetical protein
MLRSRIVSVTVCIATGFMFLDSLHRRGPYTAAYGVIFGIALLAMLAAMFLVKKKHEPAGSPPGAPPLTRR